jgi:hypothetical protein
MTVNVGLDLKMTCSACPEQYDVLQDGRVVGYLRLRHGYFAAHMAPDGEIDWDDTVYWADTEGDGVFDPDEREYQLSRALTAIAYRLARP